MYGSDVTPLWPLINVQHNITVSVTVYHDQSHARRDLEKKTVRNEQQYIIYSGIVY